MFPGVILQMTYWYRPDEMSVRLLYFCESAPALWHSRGVLTQQTFSETFPEYSAASSPLLLTRYPVRAVCRAGSGCS